MTSGRLGGISVELEGLREQALRIVRSSQDPTRCLKLMRAKVESFLESGGLGVVCKEASTGKGPGPESWSGITPALSMVHLHQGLAPVQVEATLIEPKSGRGAQAMGVGNAGFAAVEFMSASDLDNPRRTLLDDDERSIDRSLLELDEEPPDPGKLLAVVGVGPHQEEKKEDGIFILHSSTYRKHGGTISTTEISSSEGNRDAVLYTSMPAINSISSNGSANVKNVQSREPGAYNMLAVFTTEATGGIQKKGKIKAFAQTGKKKQSFAKKQLSITKGESFSSGQKSKQVDQMNKQFQQAYFAPVMVGFREGFEEEEKVGARVNPEYSKVREMIAKFGAGLAGTGIDKKQQLSSLEVSFDGVHMSLVVGDSVLGKRSLAEEPPDAMSTEHSLAIVPFSFAVKGGEQKRGMEDVVVSKGAYGGSWEATGLGAAGNLTGPYVAPRQEQ